MNSVEEITGVEPRVRVTSAADSLRSIQLVLFGVGNANDVNTSHVLIIRKKTLGLKVLQFSFANEVATRYTTLVSSVRCVE